MAEAKKLRTAVDYEVDWWIVTALCVNFLAGGVWMLYMRFGPFVSEDPILNGVVFQGFVLDFYGTSPTVLASLPHAGQACIVILMCVLTMGFTDTLVNFLPATIKARRTNPSWKELKDGGGAQQLSSITMCSISAFESKFEIVRNLVKG